MATAEIIIDLDPSAEGSDVNPVVPRVSVNGEWHENVSAVREGQDGVEIDFLEDGCTVTRSYPGARALVREV